MGAIDWCKVIYLDNEQKLLFCDQSFPAIPEAIINLYHNRVKHFDLSYNEIQSLNGIGLFTSVEQLILDNNQFTDLISFPKTLKSLRLLSINNNKIQNLDLLLAKLTVSFPNLEYLSLLGNPACPDQLSSTKYSDADYQKYRFHVINNLPKLKFLDSRQVSHFEAKHLKELYSSENKIEKFTKISKAFFDTFNEKRNYSALPDSSRSAGEHRGAYGKSRHKYVGEQSEGNRFIVNNDL